MARSSYIYLVVDAGGITAAAFTVKREALFWLDQRRAEADREGWQLWCCRDGVYQVPHRTTQAK